MAESPTDKLDEGKLDLVPMIDCIMLLLLFFILTTKFFDDKAVPALLSSDGQRNTPASAPTPPPQQIVLCLAPAGLTPGRQPSDYLSLLHAIEQDLPPGGALNQVELHLGGDDPLAVDGRALRGPTTPEQARLMSAIHSYVFAALARRERPGAATRKEQDPVVIRCFSQLPWKFTMVAYDAVRAYERFMAPPPAGGGTATTGAAAEPDESDPRLWALARRIDFAPPPVPNVSRNQLGDELYEIVNQH